MPRASGEGLCALDVSVGIDLSQPTISHHLKVLRHAGLLDRERRGSGVYYIDSVLPIRDEIERRIHALVAELGIVNA